MSQKNIKEGVSYIIPSYNHAKYISFLLDSIVLDTKILSLAYEIVIIDDGSTDNTKEILDKWVNINKEINIKVIYQKNRGITATLNSLISLVSYSYIRLCGSDDIVIPGSSYVMYSHFVKDSSLIAVSGDGIVIDSNGEEIFYSSIKHHRGNIEKLTNPKLLNNEIILNWCLTGPSTLIKTSHYDKIKYDENEVIDDFFLFLSVIEQNGLKIIPNKVNYYRIHDSNMSKTKDLQKRLRNQKSFLNGIVYFKNMEKNYPVLSAVRNLTEAKIAYLEKNFLRCFFKMFFYFYFRLKA